MRIKKIFLIITIFLLSLSVACNKNIDNENDITKSDNTQTIIDTNKENDHDLITGNGYNSDYLYTQFQLFDGDKEIPVLNCKTNFSHTFNGEAPSRMNNGVAIIGLRGSVTLRLVSIFNLNNFIAPLFLSTSKPPTKK